MKNTIYARITKAAWRRDRFSTVVFTTFVAISVALLSLTALLFTNLTGAIDNLMEAAKTSDFLQMHVGEIKIDELEQFVCDRPEVVDYQVSRFLNLDNRILMLGEQSLQDSTQDNGISMQSDEFDFMLDEHNALPNVSLGQVYVPICYESMYQVAVGDRMRIGDKQLTVAGFIRDSQMNSMMASSKRFLVCKEDYESLKSLGSEEYLISFLFAEGADCNAFKTAYENAELPMNGPTITKPLIKMMNTLSDGVVIVIILLISVFVLLISLICIRFLLLTRVAAEANEVGLLKAIGISRKEIRTMFLRRYYWLMVAGGGLGMGISIVLFQPLSAQMHKLYGVSSDCFNLVMGAVLSVVLVTTVIILYVRKVLRKLNEMTALKALTRSVEDGKKKNGKVCIALVTAVAVFLMMIPTNLYSTISSPDFATYMGIGDGELRMDLRETEGANNNFEIIGNLLAEDINVKEYALYQTSLSPVKLSDGTSMNMLLEQGNHERFQVAYSKGKAPTREGEVALSYLLSEELGLTIGDTLWVNVTGNYEKCSITGIYADITNGGKTAKLYAQHMSQQEHIMWRIAYVTLTENANRKDFIDQYEAFGAEVVDIESRIIGTYGPTMKQVKQVSVLVKMVSCTIILLVILLFVRMLIANQRNLISIQKAMGFRSMAIQKRFWESCVRYLIAGTIMGTIGGCTVGEKICAMALKSFGAVGFQFTIQMSSVICNMLFGGVAAVVAVYIGSNAIKNIKAVECCRGRE